MWRVTIGAAYEIRKPKKKNRKGESPDQASYMVRAWFRTYTKALDSQDELEELAIAGRETYEDETKGAFHRDSQDEVNIEVVEVEYNENLLDIIEETNEV